jgi:hypothetical protein
MRVIFLCLLAVGSRPALAEPTPPAKTVQIALASGSDAEKRTKAQLEAILQRYALTPWLYTTRILVDEKSIPHSHPVLTLHCRHYPQDDDLLTLSTLIHEEMHWLLEARQEDTKAAIAELRRLYPKLPVGFPDGANDEESSYLHLPVIYLELQGVAKLAGASQANVALQFWKGDHYRELYRIVERDQAQIAAVVRKHHLNAEGL